MARSGGDRIAYAETFQFGSNLTVAAVAEARCNALAPRRNALAKAQRAGRAGDARQDPSVWHATEGRAPTIGTVSRA
jgi:hypothetical protein